MTFLNYKFANKLIATTVCTIVLSACGTTSKSTKNDDPFAATPEQQEQFSLAISAMRNNQHDDALAILTPLAAQTPTLSGPQLNIGLIYLHKEQFEQAKMAFEDAIAINPDNASAHHYLGVVHKELGQFELAKASYIEALSLNPEYSVAHRNLGILYDLYLKDLPNAKKHYEKYLATSSESDKTVEIWLTDVSRRIDSE